MSKKILVLSLAVSALVLSSSLVSAEGENVTKRRPDRPEAAQIQEIREVRKDARGEVKEKMQEFRSNVAENHANRLERRFKFYFDRLTNILTRFDKRVATLKSEGKNTATVEASLASAKTKLAEAKTKGDAAVASFRAIDPAKFSEQKTEALAARDLAMAARKLFQDTHSLIKDALKALKLIGKPALPAASAAVKNAQ